MVKIQGDPGHPFTAGGLDHSKSVFSAIHMNRSEFDKFAEEYTSLLQANIAASGPTPEYFADYKAQDLKRCENYVKLDKRRSGYTDKIVASLTRPQFN